MSRRAFAFGLAVLGALGCTSFEVIEANVCGNRVLERDLGEACDTLVDDGFLCRPAGSIAECQYDCTPKADGSLQACPPGYACARDNVCRGETGEYEEPISISSDVTSWLSRTDFDGDGRWDLLSSEPPDQYQQARFRIHYFGIDSQLLETRVFPRVATQPISRDMNGDEQEDLLFSTYRVGMVPGRKDREWLPASFSSYRVPESDIRVLNVREGLVGIGTPLAALAKRDGIDGIYVPKYATARLELLLELPAPVEELVGAPLAANVFEGVDSPCDEVVLAYRGDDHVLVTDVCELEPNPSKPEVMWRAAPTQDVISLPPGVTVDSGPLSADVNGDGHLDVILGGSYDAGTADARHTNFVAYGDGLQVDPIAQPLVLALDPSSLVGNDFSALKIMPLAAGDVSGDGIADFVFPNLVLSSRHRLGSGEATYFVAYENRDLPWTMAEIADLNANGFRDVVAAREGDSGVTFVNCSASYQYVGIGLQTDGPVRAITTGDFDGDLVGDFAYVESGKPTEGTQFLAVGFGNGLGTPSVGRRVASVNDVAQLGSGVDQGFDALFLVQDQKRGGQRVGALTLFEGNPERLPLAPYALVTFSSDSRLDNSAALALVPGSFSKPGGQDVVVFGSVEQEPLGEGGAGGASGGGDAGGAGGAAENGWTQWFVPELASAAEPPIRLEMEVPPGTQPITSDSDTSRLSVSGAALDLDRDGRDEVLWLLPENDQLGCVLLVYDIEYDARAEKGTAHERQDMHFAEPCTAPELRVLPVGNDGQSALAALFGSPAKLRLFWNDGSGQLSVEQSFVVPIPEGEPVRAFALSPDEERLAVLTPRSLWVVRNRTAPSTDPSRMSMTPPLWDRVVRVASANLQNGRGVAVLDPNQDDVPSIAVADDEGIRLFEAKLR
jgi:hypothetical protein